MFEIALYISCAALFSGTLFQLLRLRKDRHFLKKSKTGQSTKSFYNIKDFVLNTFLQTKLFKAGKIRWCIHFLLFISFLYLIIVHALHDVTSSFLFDNYDPTIDPFQFLRNLTGVLVLSACAAFLIGRTLKYRAFQDRKIKYKGILSIIMILGLIVSGFLLEASKMISEPIFMEMVEEYSDLQEETENDEEAEISQATGTSQETATNQATDIEALKLFWQTNYNVVFDEAIKVSQDNLNTTLEDGRILNEEYCLYCHSNIKSAFLSNAVARALRFTGSFLNRHRIDTGLYVIHYMLSLSLLICLPFSRLSHVLFIPFASSRKNLTLDNFKSDQAFINIVSLQACTNCGYCSQVCSVYPNFQIKGNHDLLPHSKIETVKAMIRDSTFVNLWQLHKGNLECTMCHNCTDICPSGIDLQNLWSVLDKKLIAMGYADNSSFIKKTSLEEWAKKENVAHGLSLKDTVTYNLADQMDSFESCIQCTICTNVCPVVDYDSGQNDVTPHQVMNLLRLNKKHLATGTRMVWTCLTCYSCQEHCPQEIRVADILLELRNSGSKSADMMKLSIQKVHK